MTTQSAPITGSLPDTTVPRSGPPRSVGLMLRALQVRLRFVVILVAAFVVAGQWETLRNHWDRLTRRLAGAHGPVPAISADTEYFCPMDPGVVSEWPGKCGICNMALVRRKIGDAAPLPSGVLARMQLSPYRVQLAGIQTAPLAYEPLTRAVTLTGSAQDERLVECGVFDHDRAFIVVGQAAEIIPDDGAATPPRTGKVVRLVPDAHTPRLRAVIHVDDSAQALAPGTPVIATVRRPAAELEPFRSLPSNPPPIRKGDLRAVYLCPQHPDVLADARGRCPVDRKDELQRQALLDNQRVGWWCPMHASTTADHPGPVCRACGGMPLVPRVVTYRPPGRVLAVPESAVVDTGTRTVVFVERMPGMFDGVEVVLGPRCGDSYPVASGLEPGQRVAIAGAFLIDAETRLNPSLAASYFGSGRTGQTEPVSAAAAAPLEVCPVTGKPLGSMGPPVSVTVAGQTVQLCCEGCEARLRKAPEKYLPKRKPQ